MIDYKTIIILFISTIMVNLTGCSAKRMDPCKLLSVVDVQQIDSTVTVSSWAGKAGEKKENEVCMFYTDSGDPRVMLFAWYDRNLSPKEVVETGAKDSSDVVDINIPGKQAAAVFSENELKLLAVKSSNGLIGLRVRKAVENNSAEFNQLIDLSDTALSRLK